MPLGLVLVTGGSGFLGAHCIATLLRKGYRVRTTIRRAGREADVRAMLKRAGVDPGKRLQFALADLSMDAGWLEAAQGCKFILHVASPLPEKQPANAEALIAPARDGTLRVLKAAHDAQVQRVVLTSSFAAIGYGKVAKPDVFTETDWTDEAADVTPYIKSKTIAERAAWDFIKREGDELELAVINPVVIFGPALGEDHSASITLIRSMLDGKIPFLPRLLFGVVDVRDVADLHLAAMTSPEANGERFLAVAGDFMSLQAIAFTLKERLGTKASRVSTRVLPDWLVKIAGWFSATARQAAGPELGRVKNASSEKARRMLGWKPRSREEAIIATARSLIDLGLVRGRQT